MKIIFLILILIFINKSIYSSQLFKSSYYDVSFISNNIEKDKIKKLTEIKIKSIKEVLKKILNNKNYDFLYSYLTEDLINTFIKSIIISDEKIINDKYFSKIKINFDKTKIINYLRDKNISYNEYYPNKILLIIYEEDEINQNLFTKNNSFYSYFNKISQNNNLFKIPNLDINDRYLLKNEDIKNKDLEKILNFSQKYFLNEIMVVYAKKNVNNIKYELLLYSDGIISNKLINLKKDQVKEFFTILENETLDMWKIINQIQNNVINMIECRINYYNMLELKEIKNNLKNISVIDHLRIRSISYKNIEYDIYYYGDLKILSKLSELSQLKIKNELNHCEIRLK